MTATRSSSCGWATTQLLRGQGTLTYGLAQDQDPPVHDNGDDRGRLARRCLTWSSLSGNPSLQQVSGRGWGRSTMAGPTRGGSLNRSTSEPVAGWLREGRGQPRSRVGIFGGKHWSRDRNFQTDLRGHNQNRRELDLTQPHPSAVVPDNSRSPRSPDPSTVDRRPLQHRQPPAGQGHQLERVGPNLPLGPGPVVLRPAPPSIRCGPTTGRPKASLTWSR